MSQRGRGNINPNGRARNWCFTINNPPMTDAVLAETVTQHVHFRYMVFQLEKGENGTVHYQGYIEFKAPMRFNAVKTLLGAGVCEPHVEKRYSTRSKARLYCMKDEGRIRGPFEFGDFSNKQGARTDLYDIADQFKQGVKMKTIVEEHPALYCRYHKGLEKMRSILAPRPDDADLQVLLFYGPTGCGKTRTAMSLDDAFKKAGTHEWFDGYDGENILIIDDFAGRASKIPLSFMLNILDKYPCLLPIKGAHVNRRCKEIIITTNIHPLNWYDYSSRMEHYHALARRFDAVYYFPSKDEKDRLITNESFFQDWSEGCDESTVFKKRTGEDIEPSHISESEETTMQQEEDLPSTEEYDLPSYCDKCGYIFDEGESLCHCNK
jgi:hypothetical protein